MPRNKRVRRRRNRPQRSRPSRQIASISTGIPRTLKRISGNPPVINEVSTQTVRVCFNVDVTLAQSAAPFKVTVGDNPVSRNVILLTISNTGDTSTFYLDQDEVFEAAYVRIFGQKPTASTGNTTATEAAMQSVVFYGPTGSGLIKMGADFGPGMPGAVACDAGTLASRPVVKVVSPRLFWERYHSTHAGDAFAGFWIYGFGLTGHSGGGANVYTNIARIDCTVHVRRSWYSANTASAIAAKASTDVQMS